MPGSTPQRAVTAFLEPLRQAVSVLSGHGQIAAVRKGAYRKGQLYVWHLNGGNGMSWPRIGSSAGRGSRHLPSATSSP